MPEYTVTVSKSFTITARNKDIALERATVSKSFTIAARNKDIALERAEEIEEIADKLLLDYGWVH